MTVDHASSACRQMIATQLRARGITAPDVLRAMARVPRHRFVPAERREQAYEDRALEIGHGQTISQPYIVAFMTTRLDVHEGHRVLEIGTGSGYQAAILAQLCKQIYTLESVAALGHEACDLLRELGHDNCVCHIGDGTLGWPDHAPYDRIMVTAGTPQIPEALIDQLVIGGKMILPVGGHKEQRLVLIEKRLGRYVETPLLACRFVKLIGDQGWQACAT